MIIPCGIATDGPAKSSTITVDSNRRRGNRPDVTIHIEGHTIHLKKGRALRLANALVDAYEEVEQ